MSSIIEQMLSKYESKTIYDQKNAVKEIMQEIVLCALSRAGFFQHAAFYGGTALRIFYGLDRFSEDLDFSLMAADPDFELSKYFPAVKKEVASYGLNVTIEEHEKAQDSFIRSAFLKGNTKELMLQFYNAQVTGIPKNELIRIKFEIDVNPPAYAGFERRYRLLPAPYEVNLYDAPSLFAGKVHAVICRSWKSRTKGRDLYDYVFYLSQGTGLNLRHLRERLLESEYIAPETPCTLDDVKRMLFERFDAIDYKSAKDDVLPFIKDASSVRLWSREFFRQITEEYIH